MKYSYYFTDYVNAYTWEHFVELLNKGVIAPDYTQIEGYGWMDNFAFNPNGTALYMTAKGVKYKGVWFEIENVRIAIFARNA